MIELYVATAEPVGSRNLSKRFDLELSPATIRNEMADLEEAGYLEQPHTSAGRIPTDKGYRFYVDHVQSGTPIDDDRAVLQQLERQYMATCSGIRTVLSSAVKILSEVSQLTGVALSPTGQEHPIKKVQLVGIDKKRVLMVIVNASGLVTNHMLDITARVPQEILNRISDIINDNFSGESVERLFKEDLLVLRELESRYRKTIRSLLANLEKALIRAAADDRLFMEGLTLILDQPEFRSFEKARFIVDRFVDQSSLSGVLRLGSDKSGPVRRPRVTIGTENAVEGLEDFSLITSVYEGGDRGQGAIGIIGPRRMEYARIIALVGWMSRRLSELLSSESL